MRKFQGITTIVAALSALAVSVGLGVAPAVADGTAADVDATTTVAAAQSGKLDADPTIRNSMLGYYEYIGATDAVDWFNAVRNDPQRAQYLKLGDDASATSLDNALKAALSIKRGNTLRTTDRNFPGRSDLRVSHLVTAMAETATDWMASNGRMEHQNGNALEAGDYNAAGQNIAWGYANPYLGWYFEEKALYDLGVRDDGRVGHYTNITSSDFTVTGFGWSGRYSAQNFADSSTDKGVDLNEYIASLIHYRTVIQNPDITPEPDGSQVAVYRLYNPYTGKHHYTASAAEKDELVEHAWNFEGVSFTVSTGGYPVYRLYNPYTGVHHYTLSKQEATDLANHAWQDEGVAWHVPSDGNVPVYRLYNDGLGEHLFTTDFAEYERNVQYGWTQESVAWIAFK